MASERLFDWQMVAIMALIPVALLVGLGLGECRKRANDEVAKVPDARIESFDVHNDPIPEPR